MVCRHVISIERLFHDLGTNTFEFASYIEEHMDLIREFVQEELVEMTWIERQFFVVLSHAMS